MRKLKYAVPELTIVAFEAADIITTSTGAFDGDNRVFQEKFRKTPREYKNEFKVHEVIYHVNEEESEEGQI